MSNQANILVLERALTQHDNTIASVRVLLTEEDEQTCLKVQILSDDVIGWDYTFKNQDIFATLRNLLMTLGSFVSQKIPDASWLGQSIDYAFPRLEQGLDKNGCTVLLVRERVYRELKKVLETNQQLKRQDPHMVIEYSEVDYDPGIIFVQKELMEPNGQVVTVCIHVPQSHRSGKVSTCFSITGHDINIVRFIERWFP